MKTLTTFIKSQPLLKLSTVFCAHRRSLLRVLPWKKPHARVRN